METLYSIDAAIAAGSMLALFVFCVIIPKTRIAQYLYILFGVTFIPVGIKSILDGDKWYEFIWFFAFAIGGIAIGIFLIWMNSYLEEDERDELDESFGAMARKGGAKRIARNGIKGKLK